MNVFLIFILNMLLYFSAGFAKSPNEYLLEGKSFGNDLNKFSKNSMKNFEIENLGVTQTEINKIDSSNLEDSIISGNRPNSEINNFLLSKQVNENFQKNKIDSDDNFLEKSEEYFQNYDQYIDEYQTETLIKTNLEKCTQSDVPYIKEIIRNLQVNVIHKPKIEKKVKGCIGHIKYEEYFWKSDAIKSKKKWDRELSNDQSIEKYTIYVGNGNLLDNYDLEIIWKHKDDSKNCHNFNEKVKLIQNESFIEDKEFWVIEDETNLLQDPNFTYLHSECIDETPFKEINGKQVYRKCWKQKISYLGSLEKLNTCAELRQRNCQFRSKKCLNSNEIGCCLWEILYECPFKVNPKVIKYIDNPQIGQSPDDWDLSYNPNLSLNAVTTKLAVFDQIKKEMETNNISGSEILIFAGKPKECTKNIAADLLYDCCFQFTGLAKEAGLAKCNSEEIVLSDMRERGFCHYIGSYENTIANTMTTSYTHSFCCYDSKLSKVFQEEAHKQLKLDWGSPKKPNCRGLTIEEISAIDFSNLDLSKVFDEKYFESKLPSDFDQKVERLKHGLTNRIKNLKEVKQ